MGVAERERESNFEQIFVIFFMEKKSYTMKLKYQYNAWSSMSWIISRMKI